MTGAFVEEPPALLAASTLLYAGEIVLARMFRHTLSQKYVSLTLIMISLAMPVDCNNLFLWPRLGLLRVAVFLALLFLSEAPTVNLVIYCLFAKAETFLLLFPMHACAELFYRRTARRDVLLPVHRTDAGGGGTGSSDIDRIRALIRTKLVARK